MTPAGLYTTAAAIRAQGAEAGYVSASKKPRYHLRAGLEYLHWSASKLTDKRSDAWTGTVEQARACRRTFNAAAGCKIRAISPLPAHVEEVQ